MRDTWELFVLSRFPTKIKPKVILRKKFIWKIYNIPYLSLLVKKISKEKNSPSHVPIPRHISHPYHYLGGISKTPPNISCAEKNGCFSGSAHIKPYLKCSSQENRARWDRDLRCKILRSSCHLTLDLTWARCHLSSDISESERRPEELSTFQLSSYLPILWLEGMFSHRMEKEK